MKEIKIGSVVAFARDNVVREGTVQKVYNAFDTVVVNVPEEKTLYKVAISDVTVMSEPTDQEPKDEDEPITITPTEFREMTTELIVSSPTDSDIKRLLEIFSDLLYYKVFGKLPTK